MDNEEILRTKDTTTKVIINYDKDPFTTDSAQQVVYAISGRNSENRKKYTSDTGFKELFGKVLVGVLMNPKGQLVLYFEENNAKQQADLMKGLIDEARKLDEQNESTIQQRNIDVDTINRYNMPPRPPKEEKIQPIMVEPKDKLMERFKGVYSEQEIDMMINRAQIINAVDRFTGSV